MNKISVSIDNNKFKVNTGEKVIDVLKKNNDNLKDILAVYVNNDIKDFNYKLVTNSKLKKIHIYDDDGYRIYYRTLKMVLYMAIKSLYGNTSVNFISTIYKEQYFEIEGIILNNKEITKIKNKMKEIVKKDYKITKKIVSTEEAKLLYQNSMDKQKLDNLNLNFKSYVSMYFCNDMYNYFYGMMASSTGYVKAFDLLSFKDGALLIIPDDLVNSQEKSENLHSEEVYNGFIDFSKYNKVFEIENIGNMNNMVLEGNTKNIIQLAESLHQKQIVEIAQNIERKKDVKVILIAGPSSSGKTTFAQKLGLQLKLIDKKPIKISMDNYFKDRKNTPIGIGGKLDFDCLEALELDMFNNDIEKLIKGLEVNMPVYNFKLGKKEFSEKVTQLDENSVLVIEGIHALNPRICEKINNDNKFRIHISPITTLNIDSYTKVSSTDTRILRRMVRDYVTRGHNSEETLEMWGNVRKGEEKYIFPYINDVDAIFNSSLIYESGVIKTFVQPLLLQLPETSKYYSESRRLYKYLTNFITIETKDVPADSILREFIGDGSFSM